MMEDIKVALSSTGHILQFYGPAEMEKALREKNYPVCVADMVFELDLGGNPERKELFIAEMCRNMAKTIHIDSKTRHVFIGGNPEDPETGLIEYINNVEISPCSNSFFTQWELLKSLFMEFNVLDNLNKPLFSIRGLWIVDKWQFIDYFPKANITIFSPKEQWPWTQN